MTSVTRYQYFTTSFEIVKCPRKCFWTRLYTCTYHGWRNYWENVFLYFIGRLWRFFSEEGEEGDFRDEEGCYQTRIGHWFFLILPLIPLVSKIAGLPQMIELLRGVKRPIQGLSLEGEGFRKRNPSLRNEAWSKGWLIGGGRCVCFVRFPALFPFLSRQSFHD